MTQEEAAEHMNVSRPTLTRIYESARKAIAKALVEGKMILIEGGNIEFEQHWFRCKCCYQLVKEGENHVHQTNSDENDLLPIESRSIFPVKLIVNQSKRNYDAKFYFLPL